MRRTTHAPGSSGVLGTTTLCGTLATAETDGVLRMHVYDYDCPVCRLLAGEKA